MSSRQLKSFIDFFKKFYYNIYIKNIHKKYNKIYLSLIKHKIKNWFKALEDLWNKYFRDREFFIGQFLFNHYRCNELSNFAQSHPSREPHQTF